MRIFGPLISTADPSPHRNLLTSAFGMVPARELSLGAEQTQALFGVPGTARLELLRTPRAEAGAALLSFATDLPQPVLRTEETRIHLDAFRVVDFYVPDFEKALAHATSAGWPLQADEAVYETGDGGFREAHHHGPEGVVTAFLHGDADFFTDYAEVRDQVVSEPISISLPLTDAAETVAWYRSTFGWDIVYSYDFTDASFSALMASDEEFRVRSVCIGPSSQQTYVNIVDYGLPAGVGGSLVGASRAPALGVLGLVVLGDAEDVAVAVHHAPFGAPHLVLPRAALG